MAYYAALASLVQLLEDILQRNMYSKFLHGGRQSILESLHKKLVSLEELLQDYSYKGDEADDLLQGRIRDVAHQALDVIEFKIHQEVTTPRIVRKFHDLLITCRINVFSPQLDYCNVLMNVEKEVDLVVQEVMEVIERRRNEDLKLDESSFDTNVSQMAPIGNNPIMMGFDENLIIIKDKLCGQDTAFQVIPIVGMGGIGKTTLARNTFNDGLIVERFDFRYWVSVSQDCHALKVFQSIAKSISEQTGDLFGNDEMKLEEEIYKYLKGRRYLIILDDIWSTILWDDINHAFPKDCNGSRIMVTTRLWDVADYVRTSDFVHEVELLNEEHSWNLFQNKVFAHEQNPLPQLKDIGKYIVSKCCGLPLAIVVIAGILSNIKTTYEWTKVAAEVITILSRTDEHFSAMISLSYFHLSHQLKSCFLFMGSFPEDDQIDVFVLKQMWIAEGFLKLKAGAGTLEQVASDCLDDLVKRNLVIITEKSVNGESLLCIMHDLVREFSRQRACYEQFSVAAERRYIAFDDIRRMNGPRVHCGNNVGKLLRSILWFHDISSSDFHYIKWDKCNLLKVLHVPQANFSSPDAFFQMIHLKYLGIGHVSRLPRSLAMLQNLQTLVVQNSHGSLKLPLEIWTLAKLRHLVNSSLMILPRVSLFRRIPSQKLEHLQTLRNLENFVLKNDEVEMIPNLKSLRISYKCANLFSHTNKWETFHLNHLVRLSQLQEVCIEFESFNEGRIESFPSSFSFPTNLRELSLCRCELLWKDATVMGSLPYLQVLRLHHGAFVGETWEPNEGEFLQLKFLEMDGLNLQWWRAQTAHFPCLEQLEIVRCRRLEEIPLELGDIPTLKLIHVYDSSTGARGSAIQIREEQQDLENDMLQVKVEL